MSRQQIKRISQIFWQKHSLQIPHLTTTMNSSRILRKKAKKTKLNFKSNNLADYNQPFYLSELTDSIMKSHDTAVGPDEIHYEFLKHLPSSSLEILLQVFNEVWVSGRFPTSWKEATINPIPKPGKENTDPSNYRPIALTSCL